MLVGDIYRCCNTCHVGATKTFQVKLLVEGPDCRPASSRPVCGCWCRTMQWIAIPVPYSVDYGHFIHGHTRSVQLACCASCYSQHIIVWLFPALFLVLPSKREGQVPVPNFYWTISNWYANGCRTWQTDGRGENWVGRVRPKVAWEDSGTAPCRAGRGARGFHAPRGTVGDRARGESFKAREEGEEREAGWIGLHHFCELGGDKGIIVNTNIVFSVNCGQVVNVSHTMSHQFVLRRLRNMPHTVPAASRSSPQRLPEKPHSRDRDCSRSRRRLEGRPSGLGRLQLRSAPRSHRRAADIDFTWLYMTLPSTKTATSSDWWKMMESVLKSSDIVTCTCCKNSSTPTHQQEIDKAGSGNSTTWEMANWTTLRGLFDNVFTDQRTPNPQYDKKVMPWSTFRKWRLLKLSKQG